jgi:hypothetical protein
MEWEKLLFLPGSHTGFKVHGHVPTKLSRGELRGFCRPARCAFDECWGKMAEWLKAGAEIPDDPEFEIDLTGVQYGYSSKQQIQLEKKEDMKGRGMASPDLGDALAMSFSVSVQRRVASSAEPPRPCRARLPIGELLGGNIIPLEASACRDVQ